MMHHTERVRVCRPMLRTGTTLALVVLLAGCGLFTRGGDRDDRFVGLDSPRTSPSGRYTATLVAGPTQNGVQTRIVVITDAAGAQVFRDDYAYSTRHGVRVTWLSTQDQLWILSSDVGAAYVQPGNGTWIKTAITPQTRDDIPEEIARLR